MYSEIWLDPRLSFKHLNVCTTNITLKSDFRDKMWTPDTCIIKWVCKTQPVSHHKRLRTDLQWLSSNVSHSICSWGNSDSLMNFQLHCLCMQPCVFSSKEASIHKSPSENTFVILYEHGLVWSNFRLKVKAPCKMDLVSGRLYFTRIWDNNSMKTREKPT